MKMMMIEAPETCGECVFYHSHDYYAYHNCGRDYHLPYEQRRKDTSVKADTRPQWCIDSDVEAPDIELLSEVQALRDENRTLKIQIGVVHLDRDGWIKRYQSAASDFNSLREENNDMREQVIRASHMAALWKRCASKWFWIGKTMFAEHHENKRMRDELAALKKDARELSEWAEINAPEYLREAARRIIEATKEGE